MALPQAANIVAHWSAQSCAVGAVASWADSVSGIVAAEATNQPTCVANVRGGLKSVRFDGVNDQLTIATPGVLATTVQTQTFSVLILYQQISNTPGTVGTMFSYLTSSSNVYYISDNSIVQLYEDGHTNTNAPYTGLGNFSAMGSTSGNGPPGVAGATQRFYVNGSCVYSETILTPGVSANTFIIGSSTIPSPVNADIFEIIVWNVELTAPEWASAYADLCTTYSQPKPWDSATYFVVFDGDSISASYQVTSVQDTYAYKAAQSLGLTYGQWSLTAIPGIVPSQMTTKATTDLLPYQALTGKPLKVAAFEWFNQRAAAPGPQNNSLAYLAAIRSSNVKVAFGTSTDSYLTPETDRDNYNAYFDANHTSATIDAYVSLHTNTNIGMEGANAAHPTYFNADLLHLSALGYTELAGLFVTGLNAISFSQSYSYTAVGGLQIGGAVTKLCGRVPVPSGGMLLAGTAFEVRGNVPAPSGGLSLGGITSVVRSTLRTAAGGVSLAGTASAILHYFSGAIIAMLRFTQAKRGMTFTQAKRSATFRKVP